MFEKCKRSRDADLVTDFQAFVIPGVESVSAADFVPVCRCENMLSVLLQRKNILMAAGGLQISEVFVRFLL